MALARNFSLNLYREQGFKNMAQAQRKAGQGIELLKTLAQMHLIRLPSPQQNKSAFNGPSNGIPSPLLMI